MTRETLIEKVNFILDADASKEMQMFALKKNSDVPYKINVDREFVSPIIDVVAEGIKNTIVDANYTIENYSTADERKNRYYQYDLPDVPESMKVISDVIGNASIQDYDLAHNSIADLDNLIIVVSNGPDKRFAIYKHLTTVEKIAKSEKAVIGMFGDNVLKSAEQTLLRIGPSFQVIFAAGQYIIVNESFAETKFKFHDVLKRQANKLTKKLEDKKIVADMKKIKSYCDDATFCRKLVKVLQDSKILESDFDKQKIFVFLDLEPDVQIKVLAVEETGEKFIKINNKQDANTFLEIMNDEYVKSEITDIKYKAPDKDDRKKKA